MGNWKKVDDKTTKGQRVAISSAIPTSTALKLDKLCASRRVSRARAVYLLIEEAYAENFGDEQE